MTASPSTYMGSLKFTDVVDTIREFAIILLDPDGIIISWNPGAEAILGFSADEAIGQPLTIIFTPEDIERGEADHELATAIAQGRSEDERWHIRKDQGRFWGVGVLTAVRSPNGTLQGFAKIMRDRTDLKEIQDTLRQRAESLLTADERKNAFVATLVHELRNLLAPIVYSAQLLRRLLPASPKLQDPLKIIEQQSQQLNRLIEDLLNVVRARMGKVTLSLKKTELQQLVNDAVESVKPLVQSRQHELSVSMSPASIELECDPMRIQQVFVNLLTNAAKYTPPGGRIMVSATAEGWEAVLRVRDTGKGISPEDSPHIFDLFTQGGTASERTEGGLGIGLSVVKSLVGLHGGTVQVLSQGCGKGSEFIVRLPLRHRRPAEGTGPAAQTSSALP